MNPDLPQHLHKTRDLLMGSLRCHSVEKAPAAPRALIDDLTRSVVSAPQPAPRRTLAERFDALRSMVASPAFGGAAAAVAILGIASTVVMKSEPSASSAGFRGAADYVAADAIQIIMIDAPAGTQEQLSANYEDGIFSVADSADSATRLKGPKVVVDFSAQTITAFDVKGKSVYQGSLPESSTGLDLAIASAVARL